MITSLFIHTAKSRQVLNDYDNAELLGQQFKCFFTGKNAEITDYRIFRLKKNRKWKYFKIYITGQYSILSGCKLREAVEKKLKSLVMKKIYRIIPIIGYLLEMNNKLMRENPYFQLYHTITGVIVGLIITFLFL